jgi:O-antigen/teichoic acid export membrane protein
MCSGLVLFGKEFIRLWAGPGFEESYYVALLLIIPVCIPLIQNLGLSIMQAMNKFKFKSITTFVMAIFNIIMSYFFAKRWGATGAALGTTISLIVCNIILINIYYYKAMNLDIFKFWKNIFKQTIPFIIPVVFIIIIMKITSLTGIVGFVVYGSIYTSLFCLVSYSLSMNKYEKDLIDKGLIKLHLKKVSYGRNN